ncbi:hypothetical protein Trydic_g9830 [Trypoxylus dichotomus]
MNYETEERPAKEDPVNRSNESEEKLALILGRMNGPKYKPWWRNSHSDEERDQAPFDWNDKNTAVHIQTKRGIIALYAAYSSPQNDIEQTDIAAVFNSHHPTTLAGDLNSKHSQWNSKTLHRKGKQLKTIADERNLTVDTHNTGSTDVLDLVTLKNVTTPYYLESINDLSSDHLPVIMTVLIESCTIQQTIRTTNWQKFEKSLKPRQPYISTDNDIDTVVTEEYNARKNESRGDVQRAMFATKKQHGWKRHPRSKNTESSGNGEANPKKEENFRHKCHRCRKCVPDLRTNLLSVNKITQRNFDVLFTKDDASVLDKDSNVKLVTDRIGDLYYAREYKKDSSAFATNQSNNLELWHRRLGHLNYRDLVEGIRKGVIQGIKLKPTDEEYELNCDIRCKGKLTKQPFPKKSDRETALLKIIHTDVCAPMRVESLSKAKYFVEFVNDYSRYSTVYFVRTKDEVLEKAKIFINQVTNFHNRNVKCLQSDNDTEYTSKRFEDFLKERGISQRLTSPYCPEQNGVSQCRNRTLLDMARCLMKQTELPSQFWAKAVFCLNRDPAKGKFNPRGKEGKLLGYSEQTKGFRVYLPDRRRIIITRHVKFIEESSIISEQLNDFAPEELVESSENRKEVIYFPVTNDPISEADPDENIPEVVAMKRSPGRPRKERSGSRERPRKVYNMIPQSHEATFAEEAEQAFLAEIPMKLNGPDAETRKALLVTQGFSQKPGIHFNDTFAPVARLSSIRLATALADRFGMQIRQLDVTSAYLNGTLEEEIYMEPPSQLREILTLLSKSSKYGEQVATKAKLMLNNPEGKICRLEKSLYGLK